MPKKEKATLAVFEHDLSAVIDDAIQFADGEMADARIKATDYYASKALGNEEPGRSQFVVSEVRDGVIGVIPSVLRILFGAERAVEFAPRTAAQSEQAEQVTDYVSYVFSEANGGFMKTFNVLKDGLVRKIGIFKWSWDDTSHVTNHRIEGIAESALVSLVQEEGVEPTRVEGKTPAVPGSPPLVGPDGQPMGEGTPAVEATYDVEFTHTESDGTARVVSIPPQEFIFNREARSLEEAMFVGHRTRKTRGELVAMGVNEKLFEEHGGDDTTLRDSEEAISRSATVDGVFADPEAGEANEKHLYVEGFVRYDFDGDGIAELRKVCTLGPRHKVVVNEPADEANFAIFCPDPEPHTMLGQSWADRLMDLQRVKSMLTRSTLDSLSLSIYPRTAYVEGEANVGDIMNTEIGAPIRMRSAGAVQPFTHQFAGKEAFPMFDYFDNITERRIGRNRTGAALNSDALQSSTKAAVGASIDASQEQTELLARLFAEGTLKPLFKGVMKLFVKHQPRATTMRLRGKWVDIDPRQWDASMDVVVNVAIGGGHTENKIAILRELGMEQKEIITALGPQNPIYSLAQLANTRKKILNLQGFKDTREFLSDVDPNWAPPEMPPQETPEQTLAKATLQVEQMKTEKELAMKAAEFEFKKDQAEREHTMKQQQMEIDAELRRYEIDMRSETERGKADLDAQRADMDADIAAIQAEREQAHAEEIEAEDMAMYEHDQMMAQQKHEAEQAQAQEAHEREMAAPTEVAAG